jgi:hypothetical protein
VLWIPFLLIVALAAPASPADVAPDQAAPSTWQADLQERAAARDFERALALADRRLLEAPDDEDARFWRARLLSWLARWPDAEREYRRLIAASPENADYLIGLANVRLGAQQPVDALNWLSQARVRDSRRPDLFVTRGRALRSLGQVDEARAAFRTALALAPGDADALAGLASVRPEPRHRLSMAADVDHYSFTTSSRAVTESLRSTWTSAWKTDVGARVDSRAQRTAWRALGAVSRRLPGRTVMTVGGSAGPGRDIVSTSEVFVGANKGFQFGRRFVRGLEFDYEHRWLSFDEADVMTARPSATVYFPRDWQAMVAVTAARSAFDGLGSEWRPAGSARLTFPLTSLVAGRAFYATGAENYALRDQIGSFSAWTVGAGARFTLPASQDLDIYVARQQRDQGRVQTTVGIGHGFRF